jgi:gluconolactonase
MTLDEDGNVYLTTDGKKAIDVFSPNGDLIASVSVPEQPANVCFGGENRDQLYITARTSLYRIGTNQKGVD